MKRFNYDQVQPIYEDGFLQYPWIPLTAASRLLPLMIYEASRSPYGENSSNCSCKDQQGGSESVQQSHQDALTYRTFKQDLDRLMARDLRAELQEQLDRLFGRK